MAYVFSDWYNRLKREIDNSNALKQIQSLIGFGGINFPQVQNQMKGHALVAAEVSAINQQLQELTRIYQPHAGLSAEALGEELAKAENRQKMRSARDKLRLEMMQLKQTLSAHLLPSTQPDQRNWLQMTAEVKKLHTLLDSPLFGESYWHYRAKKAVRNEAWKKAEIAESSLDPEAQIKIYSKERSVFVFYKNTQQENIQLTRSELYRGIDILIQANDYIREWEQKITARDPQAEKYRGLVNILKGAKEKGLVGPEVIKFTEKTDGSFIIDCKNRQGKESALRILNELNSVIIAEKDENRASASLGAQLVNIDSPPRITI